MFLDSDSLQAYSLFQENIGITAQRFNKTFVYEPTSVSEQDVAQKGAFLCREKAYVSGKRASPSQLHGLPLKEEKRIRKMGCEMIFQGSILIRLQVNVAVIAQQLFHRFFFRQDQSIYHSRRSMMEFDVREVVMGCVFLACKMEDIQRKSRDIVMVFNYIFNQYSLVGQSASNSSSISFRHIELTSNKYLLLRDNVIEIEKIILHEIGYETFRAADTAHKYLVSFLKVLQVEKQQAHLALGYLNDAYKTVLSVQFPPQMLMAGCIYLALRVTRTPMIHPNWWTLMETSIQAIEAVAKELVYLYSLKATTLPEYKTLIHTHNALSINKVLPLDFEQLEIKAQQEQQKQIEQQNLSLQMQKTIQPAPVEKKQEQPQRTRESDKKERSKDTRRRSRSRSKSRGRKKKSKKHNDRPRHRQEESHKSRRKRSTSESRERKRRREREREREERKVPVQSTAKSFDMDKVFSRIKEREQHWKDEAQHQKSVQPIEDAEAQMMRSLTDLKKKSNYYQIGVVLDRRREQKHQQEREHKRMEEEFF